MNEVSCRIFETLLRDLDRRGLPAHRLLAGTAVPLARVRDPSARIDWDDFRAVMGNARATWDRAELVALGAGSVSGAMVRFIGVVGRLLFTPHEFYRWVGSPNGLGSQMVACVHSEVRAERPGEIDIELRMRPGFAPCPELFLLTQGTFAAMPRMLGLPDAAVEMAPRPDGAYYRIRFQEHVSLVYRVRHLALWPRAAADAARELKRAHEELKQRYLELDAARGVLERQRRVLDVAYRLGQAIGRERDVPRILDLVVEGVVASGVDGVRLVVADDGAPAGAPDERSAVAGRLEPGGEAIAIELRGRRARGRFEAWTAGALAADDARKLLELLAPTVALAIDNASAHRELTLYQEELERLVEERTAQLRQARDELADTVGRLREAQEARERIFANLSHEIRTPLSLILLAVGDVEARAGAALDERGREDLTVVVDSARKLLRLVDELLLLAAGRETALRVHPVPTDLGRLIATIAATWRPAAEAAGLTLQVHAPASLPAVVDPVAIERTVTNLLSNAVKFTPRGGRVALELGRDRGAIRIAVRDTGIGIDDELLPRLFGRFERGRTSPHARGGSGIGLSLVKQLVEAHGGSVGVARIPAGGTELHVVLPGEPAGAAAVGADRGAAAAAALRPADFGLGAAPVSTGDVLAPPDGRAGATILVAEDDPGLAAMVARLLAEEHRVIVALDGLAALDLARAHAPDLLVTDVQMPGMDGVELTRRFRDEAGDRLAPVVILSAAADLGTRLAGLGAGAIDYVVKPFDPAELRARVRSQLALRDLAVRLHRAEQLAALGTLSSGLAHELRNPANAIVNAVGPLRRLLPPELAAGDGPVGQLVDVLGECAEQIAFLSRQLLSFRRSGELELRTVPLGELVHRAVVLATPSLRGAALRTRAAAPDLPVRCAPPLVVQVLTNLIENGAHAAGPDGWVDVAGRADGGRVVIEVADSGPGVPPALRERVFEPFFTTKPPGAGTGLGLPLARDIAHRHGGVLEIRERDGRAVFVLELPGEEAA